MVSESGPLPVVWCLRDNQLVPHQVSAVRLHGAVTGAHLAAVTDFLRLVATRRLVLPDPPPTSAQPHDTTSDDVESVDPDTNTSTRKLSQQLEVPCVFLNENLNKDKFPETVESPTETEPQTKCDIRVRKMSTFALSPPRLSVDSMCSDSTYANIEHIQKTLVEEGAESVRSEDNSSVAQSDLVRNCRRPYMPRKKQSVSSIGSCDFDDPENDVIFKSKPKSSQWVSLDRIEYNPKYVNTDRDKTDFVSKWITDHRHLEEDALPELRRKSLPLKSNEKIIQTEVSRRHSDGLSCCKEDPATDIPITFRSKWHDIVKKHLLALKSADKRIKKQRRVWSRRLSGTSITSLASSEPSNGTSSDTYVKLTTLP
ncbi:uncharacterized protein LOC143909981 [Arctopsyche grandis]|uniref:uncharacterized protein LOC143909981 n=1 Tax=Arctopsyche grandis TaxID=121162 RepID=UPI00406D65C7